MKLYRGITTLLLCITILSVMALSLPAAQEDLMTRGEFVDLFIRVMGWDKELFVKTRDLSKEELYRIEVSLLAEKGILEFLDKPREGKLTRAEVASILYRAVKDEEEKVSIREKILFLVKRGYLKGGKPEAGLSKEEVLRVLSLPEMSLAIAETYMPPEEWEEEKEGEIELPVFLEPYEDPASPVE